MASLTTQPKIINGVFCVPKDDKEDRLIIDAVFANAWFVEPAKVRLPDPSHLARLIVSADSGPLYVAKSDLSNFYHHLALPQWIRPYFCLVGVRASALGLEGDHEVYPMLHTVPMGWSHSVNVAQAVHEHTLYSGGALDRSASLLSPASLVLSPSAPCHGAYIDDLFILGHNEETVNGQLDSCIQAYKHRGFLVKDSKVVRATANGVVVLGLFIDGHRHTVSLDVESKLQLILSTLKLLSQPTVSGVELASIVGRFTWAMLVRRPSMQVFHRVYRFIHTRKDKQSQMWPSVIRELLMACGLLPLLSASLIAPVSNRVIATDASELAGAVMSRPCDPRVDSLLSGPSIQHAQAWSLIIQHRWRWQEHINALELRSILLALLWLVSCKQVGQRILLLTDSSVCLGVLNKGRSSARTLRLIHNTVAALCLGAGIVVLPTHVPSELNPADSPSRLRPPS